MMLAEAGICGNRGVADGGPFVGLGLFFFSQRVCQEGWGVCRGVWGGSRQGPLFLDRYPWTDRLLKAI